MHNLGIGQVIVFTPLLSQTFSNLTQYMSVSHGSSSISGVECGGGCKKKQGEDGHINEAYQWVVEMLINRCQCEGVGIATQMMH